MGKLLLITGIAFLGFTGAVNAQSCSCSGAAQIKSAADLTSKLVGNTVCVGSAPTFEAQEQHVSGGTLIDFKRGADDPTDPTKTIGTWVTSGDSGKTIVTYNYTGGSSYSYNVCTSGTNDLGFCPSGTNTPTVNAKLKSGLVGCLIK